MNEILKEFQPTKASSQRGLRPKTLLQIFLFCLLITAFGIYIGNILFGTNSLEVLLQLESQKEQLAERVDSLQRENAKLQKEYFELKALEPE